MGGGLSATSLAINKMKNFLNIKSFLTLILLLLNQCYYNHNISTTNNENSIKETDSVYFISVPYEDPYPQLSYYYSYNFNSSNDEIIDIKAFLSSLYSKGFKIQAAWYFAGGGCGNTRTFYPPQLIIQLEKNDFDLINYNFTSLSDKPKIICEKRSSKFIPEK
jgi:hypothetical protein